MWVCVLWDGGVLLVGWFVVVCVFSLGHQEGASHVTDTKELPADHMQIGKQNHQGFVQDVVQTVPLSHS